MLRLSYCWLRDQDVLMGIGVETSLCAFVVGGDSRVAPNDAVLQAQVRVGGETSREKESC